MPNSLNLPGSSLGRLTRRTGEERKVPLTIATGEFVWVVLDILAEFIRAHSIDTRSTVVRLDPY